MKFEGVFDFIPLYIWSHLTLLPQQGNSISLGCWENHAELLIPTHCLISSQTSLFFYSN